MKEHPALAVLEFAEIAVGIVATDALLKRSPIALLRCGTISHGRFLTLIAGTAAAVEEACDEGRFHGGGSVLDHVLLADVHPQLYDAILGQRRPIGQGSLAIVETSTVSSNVRAAELALKGTPVELIEIRLGDSGLAGKALAVVHGELHDVEAAVEIARAALAGTGVTAGFRIIPAPHEALAAQFAKGTSFASAPLAELDGEKGSS